MMRSTCKGRESPNEVRNRRKKERRIGSCRSCGRKAEADMFRGRLPPQFLRGLRVWCRVGVSAQVRHLHHLVTKLAREDGPHVVRRKVSQMWEALIGACSPQRARLSNRASPGGLEQSGLRL